MDIFCLFSSLYFFSSCSVTLIQGFTGYMTGLFLSRGCFCLSSIIFQFKLHDSDSVLFLCSTYHQRLSEVSLHSSLFAIFHLSQYILRDILLITYDYWLLIEVSSGHLDRLVAAMCLLFILILIKLRSFCKI